MANRNELQSEHYHYWVYGQKLCSSIPLVELQPANFEGRDLRFRHNLHSVDSTLFNYLELVDRRPTNLGCDISVHRTCQGYVLDWDGICRFHISNSGDEIVSDPSPKAGYLWITATLYGMVLSYALQLKGVPNLHASGVVMHEQAVGFLADPGSGKSSLAAALVANGGRFLTDDVLAVRETDGDRWTYPGFPYISLAPEIVKWFRGGIRNMLPLNASKSRFEVDGVWGTFADAPARLQALYTLNRIEGAKHVRIEQLSRVEAVRSLMEHTNVLPILPIELQKRQLTEVSRLAQQLPVYQLTYPSGFGHLHEVINEIADLALEPVGR